MEPLWTVVLNWLDVHSFELTAVVVVSLMIAPYVVMGMAYHRPEDWGWLDWPPRRRGRMLRKQRLNFVMSLLANDFTDRIEMRVYHNHISRDEAREAYRLLKQHFPVRNLFPAPERLKEDIKSRRAKGLHAPVELPDSKKKAKPRHAFDKVVM